MDEQNTPTNAAADTPVAAATVAATAAPPGQADAVNFYRPDNYQPEESVGYLIRRILATVSMEVERELEPSGLTNAQWVPLLKLYMGVASTVAEVARECQMDAGATTRLLDRLEAKGLLRRIRSSEDRRVVNLELTPEGREAARQIPAVLCKVQNAHLKGFSAEEWQQLKGLLRRILANAQGVQATHTAQASQAAQAAKENNHDA